MSKAGKVGTIVFFLFSIGAVITALKVVGDIEDGRKKIEDLTVSLNEKKAELVRVMEEKTTLEGDLRRERELKEEMRRKLSQKIEELREEVKEEKEKKVAWKNKFEDLVKTRIELGNKYREAQQTILNLQAMLKESPPDVKPQVIEDSLAETSPLLLSRRIGGEVMVIAKPFLSLELDREEIADLQLTLSIYRKGKLIKELATKGIRYTTLIARVSEEESLEGIRENDRVNLSLTPGVTGIFNSSRMEGEVLDVINPGFLNIDLGEEGLGNVEPTLLVYRGGELFRKIELKDMDHLTIVVEASEGTAVKGVKKKDIVKIVQ